MVVFWVGFWFFNKGIFMDVFKKICVGRICLVWMSDVWFIYVLFVLFVVKGLMLFCLISSFYDYLCDFVVYEEDGEIYGICVLYICWDDLVEICLLVVIELY